MLLNQSIFFIIKNNKFAFAILLLYPFIIMAIKPFYFVPQIVWADSSIYTGLFTLVKNVWSSYETYYFETRFPVILPGYILNLIFNRLLANYILHFAYFYIVIFALFIYFKKYFDNYFSLLSVFIFSLFPYTLFYVLNADYIVSPAFVYLILCFLTIDVAAHSKNTHKYFFLTGILMGIVTLSHLGMVPFFLALAVFAVTKLIHNRKLTLFTFFSIPITILSSAVLTILLCCFLNVLLFGGKFNLLGIQYEHFKMIPWPCDSVPQGFSARVATSLPLLIQWVASLCGLIYCIRKIKDIRKGSLDTCLCFQITAVIFMLYCIIADITSYCGYFNIDYYAFPICILYLFSLSFLIGKCFSNTNERQKKILFVLGVLALFCTLIFNFYNFWLCISNFLKPVVPSFISSKFLTPDTCYLALSYHFIFAVILLTGIVLFVVKVNNTVQSGYLIFAVFLLFTTYPKYNNPNALSHFKAFLKGSDFMRNMYGIYGMKNFYALIGKLDSVGWGILYGTSFPHNSRGGYPDNIHPLNTESYLRVSPCLGVERKYLLITCEPEKDIPAFNKSLKTNNMTLNKTVAICPLKSSDGITSLIVYSVTPSYSVIDKLIDKALLYEYAPDYSQDNNIFRKYFYDNIKTSLSGKKTISFDKKNNTVLIKTKAFWDCVNTSIFKIHPLNAERGKRVICVELDYEKLPRDFSMVVEVRDDKYDYVLRLEDPLSDGINKYVFPVSENINGLYFIFRSDDIPSKPFYMPKNIKIYGGYLNSDE